MSIWWVLMRCSSSKTNPVYARRVNSLLLVCSLSSHRHSYIPLIFGSLYWFIINKIYEGVHESCLCIFWRHRRAGGEGSVYWGQQTHVIEDTPPRQVINVRISVDDDGGYPRYLESWVVLWECLVLCQVGCVWLTRVSETQGDSHTCHSPDESWVHGVHEGQLPRHSIVGIQISWYRCMCVLMEVSRLLRTMRTMSRSLRWGKKSAGLKAG